MAPEVEFVEEALDGGKREAEDAGPRMVLALDGGYAEEALERGKSEREDGGRTIMTPEVEYAEDALDGEKREVEDDVVREPEDGG
jgi:hypothetical protein